jgi:hypothetical protein
MQDSHAAVSRRSVLVSGLVVSLLGASAGAAPLSQASESVLSGRLTDGRSFPLRHAELTVEGVTTRTDGDGRFFVRAVLPAQGYLSLQVVRSGEVSGVTVSALPDRTRSEDRDTSSLSLVMAG